MNEVTYNLPKYKCHKEVWAVKVRKVLQDLDTGAFWIVPDDPCVPMFSVTEKFVLKHSPEPGGYYVRYADGYESFSPAKAFEEGYTLIDLSVMGENKPTSCPWCNKPVN